MKNHLFINKILFSVFLIGFFSAEIHALPPPRPSLIDPYTMTFRTSGQPLPIFPKEVRTYRRSPLGGKYPLRRRNVTTFGDGARPLAVDTKTENSVRPLVLLIDFDDRPSSASPSISDPSVFTNLYFGAGVTDLSLKNYWEEVSYGTFTAIGSSADIVGWLRAGTDFPTTITSSAQISGVQVTNVRQLLADAISQLEGTGFDFTPYVRPSDNTFQAVIIHHTGYGQEDTGAVVDPYSHTAQIAPIVTAQGDIADYVIVPSLQSPFDPALRDPAVDPLIGIGVIVHEMGHLFGLPDLYPTGTFGQVGDPFSGVGIFDLMGYGLWGSNLLLRPDTPAHLSAWSKFRLGWLSPTLVTATTPRNLLPVELFPEADKVFSNTPADPTQYFLVENREVSSSLGNFLFDQFLPGAGIVIWQVDEVVINNQLPTNTVNSNPDFRGLYVKEADGVSDMALSFAGVTNPNDRAPFFGEVDDYFADPAQVFDRNNPSSAVNSSPIVDNTFTNHPVDFGGQVTMLAFTRAANNSVDYVVSLEGSGGGGAAWRTFNVASTQPPKFPAPMRSNDILSIAFDSGNNVWMGSADEGIFRFLGTAFEFLATARGLPSGSGTPVAPIQVMTFEPATGSMWVGTDQGLFKMRDAGSGFRVQTSFTTASPSPRTLPVSNDVQAIAVRSGTDIKYAGTPVGLSRIIDGLTDAEPDDFVSIILTGDVRAIAIDDNGNTLVQDDIVWVGFADGTLFRSLLASEGGPADGDPLVPGDFKSYSLAGSPVITSLSVDKLGRLWIGTETRGVQVFDLGETLTPAQPNLRDPFDFNNDGDTVPQEYLDTGRGLTSNNVTGIAFQATVDPDAVAWMSHLRDLNIVPGGVSRFDANAANDNVTIVDERVTVFRPEAGVLPEDQTNGPASTWVNTAAADSAGNVWFGTTEQDPQGVSRFGNAGVISLDSSNYVNVSVIATVTLQDDGLNTVPTLSDLAIVRVTSTSDGTGFFMILAETGPDTGVFSGQFGFTNGASDGGAVPPLIRVENGNTVTVTYVDFNPPGVRTASATWRSVFPFDDSLLIEGGECFIATAAYGSVMAPQVRTFRLFRDEYLLTNKAGRVFVFVYYRLSPPLAAVISGSPVLRSLTRFLLVPAYLFSDFAARTGNMEKVTVFLIAFFIAGTIFLPSVRRRKRRHDKGSIGE